ncbi:Leucine-rich repeat-containing protein 49 [Rhizophlyctis rosea]|uniref:Leucine-rich repeat-containing protein 49 n=1 Tax=Rhizophlyctis rosea TaxID=64517 RepID=A0AAD5S3N1_9FUNG|nr:Leucine-rich repeat-containing protein 49 [Rhizophlyctis rosea]
MKNLDGRRVTEEERREATRTARRQVERRKDSERDRMQFEERKRRIATIRSKWEEQSKSSEDVGLPIRPLPSRTHSEDVPLHSSSVSSPGWRPSSARPGSAGRSRSVVRNGFAEGGKIFESADGYAEIKDGLLSIYGNAFIAFEKADPGTVTAMEFNFTNFARLKQANHLACLRNIRELNITEENPITSVTSYQGYVLFRLAHLPLRKLCGVDITKTDVDAAEKQFAPLRKTVSSIPSYILGRTPDSGLPIGVGGPTTNETGFAGFDQELNGIPTGRFVAPKTASRKIAVGPYVDNLVSNAIEIQNKLQIFNEMWPQLVEKACEEGLLMGGDGCQEAALLKVLKG